MAKHFSIRSLYPHFIAIGTFLVVTLVYFHPIMQGKVLFQSDIIQWKGMSREVVEYREKTGEEALWTNSMFSGMPAFQISLHSKGNLTKYLEDIITLWMPKPLHVVIIGFIGFYVLMLVMGFSPWLSMAGALAFGLSSYSIVSLEAGHLSKVKAIALIAPTLAGIILAYRGKMLLGAALTLLFLTLEIGCNHFQITYYLVFLTIITVITFGIIAIRERQLTSFIKTSALLLVVALLAAGPNASRLFNTYVYAKDTIRGGSSELTIREEQRKGKGLDWDYAMSWSQGKMETFTLLIPYFMGGSSHESLNENSNTYKVLVKRGVPANQAEAFVKQLPLYRGDQPFTSGPIYYGAVVCFLFLLGMIVVKNPLKWGLFAAFVLFMMLSWGKNFPMLSRLFFDYVPMYNKFRSPSMLLGAAEFIFPFIGFWGLHAWMQLKDRTQQLKVLRLSAGITAGIAIVFGLIGSFFYDFSAPGDERLLQQFTQMTGDNSFARAIINGLIEDRQRLLQLDSLRTLLFISFAAGLMYLFARGKVKSTYLLAGIGFLALIDLWAVDKRYLNADDFVTESDYERQLAPKPYDLEIKKDPDLYYRVFNSAVSNPFSDALTSYHHKSVGGYHAAKLIRYQDLIEFHLSKGNMKVFNMLNTKYFIVKRKGNIIPQRNPDALGNAWFISDVQWVENADEEILALNDFDPANTVVIDKRFSDYLAGYTFRKDPSGYIRLTSYSPRHLVYESSAASPQFGVFSEVYYNDDKGWHAYIDGQQVPHIRVNYTLRGLKIPEGKHTIEFKFEPRLYFISERIALASSILVLLFIFSIFGLELKANMKTTD